MDPPAIQGSGRDRVWPSCGSTFVGEARPAASAEATRPPVPDTGRIQSRSSTSSSRCTARVDCHQRRSSTAFACAADSPHSRIRLRRAAGRERAFATIPCRASRCSRAKTKASTIGAREPAGVMGTNRGDRAAPRGRSGGLKRCFGLRGSRNCSSSRMPRAVGLTASGEMKPSRNRRFEDRYSSGRCTSPFSKETSSSGRVDFLPPVNGVAVTDGRFVVAGGGGKGAGHAPRRPAQMSPLQSVLSG